MFNGIIIDLRTFMKESESQETSFKNALILSKKINEQQIMIISWS